MIAKITLEFEWKKYVYNHHFKSSEGENYPWSGVEYMYYEGNYNCDCNRSLFIQRYCDKNFPLMTCGERIKLIDLEEVKGDKP